MLYPTVINNWRIQISNSNKCLILKNIQVETLQTFCANASPKGGHPLCVAGQITKL